MYAHMYVCLCVRRIQGLSFWNSEDQAAELCQPTVCSPCPYFSPEFGNRKVYNTSQDTSINLVPPWGHTDSLMKDRIVTHMFFFLAQQLFQDSLSRAGAMQPVLRTESKEALSGRFWGACSPPLLNFGTVCISSSFLLNSSSQLDRK